MQEQMAQFHCLRWNELPNIPLYLDQLVMVVQSSVGIFFKDEPAVTKTMINNYVKQGLLSAPQQKKYGRNHIARIIVISLLKRVFSMNEIHLFMETMVNRHGAEFAYNMFCDKLENLLHSAFSQTLASLTIPLSNEYKDEEEYLFTAVLLATVCKFKVQDILEHNSHDETEPY